MLPDVKDGLGRRASMQAFANSLRHFHAMKISEVHCTGRDARLYGRRDARRYENGRA